MEIIALDLPQRESQLAIKPEDGTITDRRIVTSRELDRSPTLTTELAPLNAVCAPLNAQITVADARIAMFAKRDPIATRLTTAPGVAPVTARALVATIDDITRFRTAQFLRNHPDAPGPSRPIREREQKAEQHLEGRTDNKSGPNGRRSVPGSRAAGAVGSPAVRRGPWVDHGHERLPSRFDRNTDPGGFPLENQHHGAAL